MPVLKWSDRFRNVLHHILGLSKLDRIILNREIPAETINEIILPKSTLNVLKKRLLHSSIVLLKRLLPSAVFPILQLPYLVLEGCLKQFDIMEIIQFSFCSQKTKDLVRMLRYTPLDFKIRIDGRPTILIRFTNQPGLKWVIDFENLTFKFKSGIKIEKRKLDGTEYSVIRKTFLIGPLVEHNLMTYWRFNFEEGLRKWVEHLCYIFAPPITEMIMDESSYEGDILSVINWSSTLRLDNVCFDSNFTTKKNFEVVLQKLKASKIVCLDTVAEDGVQYKTSARIIDFVLLDTNEYWFLTSNCFSSCPCFCQVYKKSFFGFVSKLISRITTVAYKMHYYLASNA